MPTDYYTLLGVSPTTAYKKESLKTHPDRVPQGASERTRREATVADAYYVLSDPTRRASYDRLRPSRPSAAQADAAAGSSMPGGFSFDDFSRFFAGQQGFDQAPSSDGRTDAGAERPDADTVFGDEFEDLLRPEVERRMPIWKYTGMLAGAALGFIVGNAAGAAIGAYGGSRVGHLRDIKGRAVIEVFKDLPQAERVAVLKALALKVLGSLGQ